MKVVQSVQELYSSRFLYYELLKKKVDESISLNKKEEWYYFGRLKSLESFALKIETGRFSIENIFDDFFGCTIVVRNKTEIDLAVSMVRKIFEIVARKPATDDFTHKQAPSFEFDDLRLYCSLKDEQTSFITTNLLNLVFEIQVKTFLQHAWSISTHDLIYKTDEISWGKERVAYQIKASLEQAEIMISGLGSLSSMVELNKTNKETKKINNTLKFILKFWSSEDLPIDKKRLASNICELVETLGLGFIELSEMITNETNLGRGTLTKNLSPYQIIIQSIANQKPDVLKKFINSKNSSKFSLLITKEMNMPVAIRLQRSKIFDLR